MILSEKAVKLYILSYKVNKKLKKIITIFHEKIWRKTYKKLSSFQNNQTEDFEACRLFRQKFNRVDKFTTAVLTGVMLTGCYKNLIKIAQKVQL